MRAADLGDTFRRPLGAGRSAYPWCRWATPPLVALTVLASFYAGDLLASRVLSMREPSMGEVGSRIGLANGRRRAYVMIAYDDPGSGVGDPLWGAVALAQSVKRFTTHSVVLLTNHRTFPNGDSVKQAFSRMGVDTRPVEEIDFGFESRIARRFQVSAFKMQAWNLTDFDDVIWLDADSLVFRDIDYLFDRPGLWMARDDWGCQRGQMRPNSGIMKLSPEAEVYQGLVAFMKRLKEKPVHEVIATFYKDVMNSPVQLLSDLEASFGRCAGHPPKSPYLSWKDNAETDTNGLFSQPAFVHKSGGVGNSDDGVHDNICFQHHTERQMHRKGKTTLNVCHFHSLAPTWRARFCEGAVKMMGLGPVTSVGSFCHDRCYYAGAPVPGLNCPGGVVSNPDILEYWGNVRGTMLS